MVKPTHKQLQAMRDARLITVAEARRVWRHVAEIPPDEADAEDRIVAYLAGRGPLYGVTRPRMQALVEAGRITPQEAEAVRAAARLDVDRPERPEGCEGGVCHEGGAEADAVRPQAEPESGPEGHPAATSTPTGPVAAPATGEPCGAGDEAREAGDVLAETARAARKPWGGGVTAIEAGDTGDGLAAGASVGLWSLAGCPRASPAFRGEAVP